MDKGISKAVIKKWQPYFCGSAAFFGKVVLKAGLAVYI